MELSSAVWFPIVTLVIGAVLTLFSDWRRFVRDSSEARNQRTEERMRILLAEQRQLLLEISSVATEFGRSVALCHFEDEKNHRETGVWGKAQLGRELDMRLFEDGRKLASLSSRVICKSLRENLLQWHASYATMVLLPDKRIASLAFDEFLSRLQAIQQCLGDTVRALDLASFGSAAVMGESLGLPM